MKNNHQEMKLSKYLALAKITWQNQFMYRVNFIVWRCQVFISSLMAFYLWQVLFLNKSELFNYQQQEMLCYIFITLILQSLIVATGLQNLADDIYSGRLSHWLLKPINFFSFLVAQDYADKIKNIFFAIGEFLILYLIFQPNFHLPSLIYCLLFIISLLGGLILFFLIMLVFGLIGFWTPDTWALRFLFFTILEFTAGRLYPLDILPKTLQQLIYFTPFPYLTFTQTQIFLARMPIFIAGKNLLIIIFWIGLLLIISKLLWQKGIKAYQAAGQ